MTAPCRGRGAVSAAHGHGGKLMAEGLRFRQTLSHMTTLHRLGVLVPFVGSGMSLPTCTGWVKFLTKLAESAGVDM